MLGQLWQVFQAGIGVILRHPIVGVTLIPVLADGRIVLVKRRDSGRWSLPGGMIDWGEEIAHTIHREMVEETGLEVVDIRRLVGVYASPRRDPRFHAVSICIEVAVTGSFEVQDQIEIKQAQPFDKADIVLEELAHDHAQQLKTYFAGQTAIA
ncbi:MAG: NUDIX hydrolase [Cyanobacteria bacterium P01_A01_bin.135]